MRKRMHKIMKELFEYAGFVCPCSVVIMRFEEFLEYVRIFQIQGLKRTPLGFYAPEHDKVFLIYEMVKNVTDNELRLIIAHEVGHAFGIDHIENNVIMKPEASIVDRFWDITEDFKHLVLNHTGRTVEEL